MFQAVNNTGKQIYSEISVASPVLNPFFMLNMLHIFVRFQFCHAARFSRNLWISTSWCHKSLWDFPTLSVKVSHWILLMWLTDSYSQWSLKHIPLNQWFYGAFSCGFFFQADCISPQWRRNGGFESAYCSDLPTCKYFKNTELMLSN